MRSLTSFIVLLLSGGIFSLERIPGWSAYSEFKISDEELLSIGNELRKADENAALPGQIRLNYQGHTNTRDEADNANERLFSAVNTSLLRRPSYDQFIALMNNFNRQTGENEPLVSFAEHKREVGNFLTTVINSKPLKKLYDFLNKKGHPFARDPLTWRFWLAQLWFVHYSRARGRADTSGFEHVFIGEVKNGEVSGMHNWLRFYLLEKDAAAHFDYKGFVIKRFNVMAALKFSWGRELKRSGSMLLGTSPEFDLALYSLCFLSRRGRQTCNVEIDGCPLSITSFDLTQNGKVFIGSIFPSAGRITDSCRMKNS